MKKKKIWTIIIFSLIAIGLIAYFTLYVLIPHRAFSKQSKNRMEAYQMNVEIEELSYRVESTELSFEEYVELRKQLVNDGFVNQTETEELLEAIRIASQGNDGMAFLEQLVLESQIPLFNSWVCKRAIMETCTAYTKGDKIHISYYAVLLR